MNSRMSEKKMQLLNPWIKQAEPPITKKKKKKKKCLERTIWRAAKESNGPPSTLLKSTCLVLKTLHKLT